jgi:hypothetical protein
MVAGSNHVVIPDRNFRGDVLMNTIEMRWHHAEGGLDDWGNDVILVKSMATTMDNIHLPLILQHRTRIDEIDATFYSPWVNVPIDTEVT